MRHHWTEIVRDIGAGALARFDRADRDQHLDRFANDAAGNAEEFTELALRGQPGTWRKIACPNPVEQLLDGRLLPPVTLSLGLAVFPDDGSSAEALLKAADLALYEAKASGRDRIIQYSQLGRA